MVCLLTDHNQSSCCITIVFIILNLYIWRARRGNHAWSFGGGMVSTDLLLLLNKVDLHINITAV